MAYGIGAREYVEFHDCAARNAVEFPPRLNKPV
jgi:hypothetical protein